MTQALDDVIAERARQFYEEGFQPQHDAQHTDGSLAVAAGTYALHAGLCTHGVPKATEFGPGRPPSTWPWTPEWWKPTNPRRDLVKAAALILAEIERIDRANEAW